MKKPINFAGNQVVLKLGPKRFAVYAHLQPRSVAVHAGQRVRTGQKMPRSAAASATDGRTRRDILGRWASPFGRCVLGAESDAREEMREELMVALARLVGRR